jgi:BirA family biotin operon repressor/biotin-[acetyl-CoA-carboxylase] ligase
MVSHADVCARLRTRWAGRPLEIVEQCNSTNDLVAAQARVGAPAGLCVIADRQTRGRGRHGRAWFSPSGANLYLSLLARPALPARDSPPLALAVGVAAREALAPFGLPIDLKWPNDLLVRGRKLGGVLIETSIEGERVGHVVIGVGINVNLAVAEFPEELRPSATSVAIETGRRQLREPIAAALLERLEDWTDRFVEQGSGPAVRAFRAAAGATIGRRVQVGGRTAVAEQIQDDGALQVRDNTGVMHIVYAGELEG